MFALILIHIDGLVSSDQLLIFSVWKKQLITLRKSVKFTLFVPLDFMSLFLLPLYLVVMLLYSTILTLILSAYCTYLHRFHFLSTSLRFDFNSPTLTLLTHLPSSLQTSQDAGDEACSACRVPLCGNCDGLADVHRVGSPGSIQYVLLGFVFKTMTQKITLALIISLEPTCPNTCHRVVFSICPLRLVLLTHSMSLFSIDPITFPFIQQIPGTPSPERRASPSVWVVRSP